MISPRRDEIGNLIREILPLQAELVRLEAALPTRTRIEKAEIIRQSIKDKKEEIKVFADAAEAEAEAAEQAAEDVRKAAQRERDLAQERDARLKAVQNAAKEFNEKQKAFAAAWEKSWGRAIENTQDSFAEFFKSLITDGVPSFREFADKIFDIWANLSAQIAATKLFQAFLGTALGQGLTEGGRPNLIDIPTSLPAGVTPSTGQSASVQPSVPVVVHLNVAAMDAASFQVFAEANKGIIASAVAEAAQDSVVIRRAFRGR
jgi:hypothetical protein